MLNTVKNTRIWFGISGVLIVTSIVFLLTWGLPAGIDFKGGSLSELEFENPVQTTPVREELLALGFGELQVQPVNEKKIIIKTKVLSEAELDLFKQTLTEKFGPYEEISFESIGPTISRELIRKSYIQVALVLAGILFYLAYAFRKMGGEETRKSVSPWHMGIAAVLALIHDLIITIGFFSLLGKTRGVEVDNLFITALLTIAGFSVHDTIVVFDRIRENLKLYKYKTLESIIDFSVSSTFARSINTSSTLIFVLVALLLFGGQTIFNFVLALLVGAVFGTYSSIFIASPILNLLSRKRVQ